MHRATAGQGAAKLEDNLMRFDPVACGTRIKTLREGKELTQMQLAEQIMITTDHLRAVERGRRACSIDLLVDFSAFLRCPWTF